ncbi:MAG: hypothetical protein MJ118_06395 [Clostridia bacterium]|nr:hypothetical protein [Clostridia bacterium]
MKLKMPELKDTMEKAKRLLLRFRLPILFLVLGLLLLSMPQTSKKRTSSQQQPAAVQPECDSVEILQERLKTVLSSAEGVGRVEIVLSLAKSEESVFQEDVRRTYSDSGSTEETTTVFSSGSASQKVPVIAVTNQPVFRGALVVCDGADSAGVRLSVVNAVSGLTGLGSDKITVVKMKGK